MPGSTPYFVQSMKYSVSGLRTRARPKNDEWAFAETELIFWEYPTRELEREITSVNIEKHVQWPLIIFLGKVAIKISSLSDV